MSGSIKSLRLLDGHLIPQLSFGTGTAHFGKDAEEPVRFALEHKFSHIDAAQMYKNEEYVGNALAAFLATSGVPRESLYITTKLDMLAPGETPLDSLKTSLGKLQLKYVDLFLVHFPTVFSEPGVLERVWKGMEEIKEAGLATSIGVSNFRIRDLERVLKVAKYKPVVNQIEFHPYVYKQLLPLLQFQEEHGILTESYAGLTPVNRTSGPVTPVLQKIITRMGGKATEGQVLLRWLEAKGVVAITTTSKPSRLTEYLEAYSLPELTEEEVQEIDAAGALLHSRLRAQHMDEL